MVVLLEGSPLSREQHLSSVRATINFLVTSLTEALYPNCSRKSPGGYKLFGTINTPEIFLSPSPDLCLNIILSQRSADNSLDLMVWFVL